LFDSFVMPFVDLR